MINRHRALPALVAVIAALPVLAAAQQTATPGAAQRPAAAAPVGLAADLLADIGQVESKMLGLARAIPLERYEWRPGTSARSVGEVLRHVAADNYFLPASLGHAADPTTGIKGDDFNTAVAFERRTLDRAQTIALLERSFANLKQALGAATPAKLNERMTMFGQQFSGQQAWLLTTTHLHEHLGQLIAYARSNNVVPPWSQ